VAAQEQGLTAEERELVAIGASIGAGCHSCVDHHLKAGTRAGLSAERLLAGVINAELASAESAERLSEHVRAALGSEVKEPRAAAALDEALACLGGALGSNDLANVKHQLLVCRQLGMSRLQLRQAIELGRGVQENATRIHYRAALDLLGRAAGETDAGAPDFVAMMARLLALMDACDSDGLAQKMAECFSVFGASCCDPSPVAPGEKPSGSSSASPNQTAACDCSYGCGPSS
jgi:AhpD family alkylhydroperoxidase